MEIIWIHLPEKKCHPSFLICICSYKFHALPQITYRRSIWNPVEHLHWSFFAEIKKVLKLLAIFAEELHHGSLTGCCTEKSSRTHLLRR